MDEIVKSAVRGGHTLFLRAVPPKKEGLPVVYVMECYECGEVPENAEHRIPKVLHQWTDGHQAEMEQRFDREASNHMAQSALWGIVQRETGPFRF